MSKKFAFLFPGQGAQEPGMLKDICEAFPEASKLVDRLINGKFALVFMTNSVANQITNHIEKHNLEFTPIIGRIPD